MAPSNPGGGGNGGFSNLAAMSSGGGGGGGYFGGGGGGVDDPAGINAGAGGGGSGFNDPSTTVLSTSTNTGDGSVTITYPVPATTTTSGILLDATTGVAIPNSCVVFSPAAFPGRTNYDSVGGDGTWSFTTAESGPFDLAFYTTANGDCSQPILPTPVPSWYINQPLSGTDEHVITPPPGATTVDAGTSGIVACLGATALPTGPCATPQVVLSGHVDTTGPVPLANVCVFVVDASGNGGQAMTDAQGNWSVSGLPAGFNVVVIFVPFFSGTRGPCKGNGGGGPPVPGPGQLQPVFYGNVWANLGRSHLSERPLHMGGPARGHHLERAHRQRRRLHHQCGRYRGPQTELQPECRGRRGERFDHAGGGSSSAQCVSIAGLYRCDLPPTRHDRIRPASRRLGPPRHLFDRPATLAAQPRAHERAPSAPYEPSHGPLSRIKIPSVLLPRSRRLGTPR